MGIKTEITSRERVPGAERRTTTLVMPEATYEGGGLVLPPKELGLTKVEGAICVARTLSQEEGVAVGSCWYDKSKSVLRINDYKTQKELAAVKTISSVVIEVHAWGL